MQQRLFQQTRTTNFWRLLFLMAVVSFGTEHQLHAYVDPGSGALIWQTVLAAFAGLVFYGRRILRTIRRKGRGEEMPPAK